jgi:hypothetical protein
MWQRAHSARSDAEAARQLGELPLEPESIYDRLMRTRGVAMKATAKAMEQQQPHQRGDEHQRLPDARLQQINQVARTHTFCVSPEYRTPSPLAFSPLLSTPNV